MTKPDSVHEMGLETLEALREYVAALRTLQKRCGPRDPEFANAIHRVQFIFFSDRLERDVEHQFAHLPALRQQLTAAEQKELLEAFITYCDGGFLEEDLDKRGLIDPAGDVWQQIKALPLWTVIKKFGWASRLERRSK